MIENLTYEFDEIESCECIGEFHDEWVYDVEVDDETHTFIANDILVHNSLFVSFKPAMDHCEWRHTYESELEFIQALDKHRYAEYFKKCLDDFAATYGVENKQDFELERISESIINIAKKKYINILFMKMEFPMIGLIISSRKVLNLLDLLHLFLRGIKL